MQPEIILLNRPLGTILMLFSVTFAVLGLTSRDWAFTPQGETVERRGTTHTLIGYDFATNTTYAVVVPDDLLPKVNGGLGPGDLITAPVRVSSRDNKTRTVLDALPTVLGSAFELTGTAADKAA